jgi:hypothetical protein
MTAAADVADDPLANVLTLGAGRAVGVGAYAFALDRL